MKKSNVKNPHAKDVAKVFAVGGASALMSAAAVALAYVSINIFCCIPFIKGYLAVGGFALALVAAAAALAMVYVCGAWVVGKGKFSK